MPAERIPHLSLMGRILSFITKRVVLRAPRMVLGIGLALAAAAGVLATTGLEMKTSRLDLLNPRSEFNRRWLAYLDEFGEDDDAVLVVEGARRQEVIAALDALGQRLLAHQDQFPSIIFRVDVQRLKQKGLYFLEPAQLREAEEFAERFGPLMNAPGPVGISAGRLLLGATLQVREAAQTDDAARLVGAERHAVDLVESLSLALETAAPTFRYPSGGISPQASALVSATGHLLASDGRLGFILVAIRRTEGQLSGAAKQIELLRATIEEVAAEHSAVDIGLTGLPILEYDEMQTSQQDMSKATLYSLIGVALLFIVGFGQLRLPLLAVVTLLIGIAWCFGFITLCVGHLNLLSVSFGAILVGLGIDFGIHIIARYLDLRGQEGSSTAALARSVGEIGPGMMTGALTTSAAFLAAAVSDFTGIAELGLIAGGGVVLCLVAALVVLPAMMLLSEQRREQRRGSPSSASPIGIGPLCRPASKMPQFTVVLCVLTTAVLATGLPALRFDHNLLHLQADNLDSVAWEQRLLSRGDQSVWFAVSMCDTPAELLKRKRDFEQLPSVSRVEEIASVTADIPRKLPHVQRLLGQLRQLPTRPPERSPLPPMAAGQELRHALSQSTAMVSGVSTPLLHSALRRLAQRAGQFPAEQLGERLNHYSTSFVQETWQRLAQLRGMASADPPSWNDVPPAWRSRFLGKNGRHALRIFARGDIWDMDRLAVFVNDLERVDPRVTGHPVQTFYASRQMQRSYVHAAIYAAIGVLIILMLDFKSLRVSGLSLLPLGMSFVQTLGIMGLLDIPLNAANMIVLPLLIGIGIDNGVHIIHDFQRRTGEYRLSNATATAITLTSATTTVGFGSMMVAHHQGLRSLGQVLTLGVGCCLWMSLIFLPAVLTLVAGQWGTARAFRPADADERDLANAFSATKVTANL